jgi:putative peptidoglycan lipid II flippase
MAAAAQRSSADVKKTLVFALRLTLFLTIPALLGLAIFRQPIIHLLFERGAFTRGMTLATAQVVLGYSLGLCFFVANRVLVPAFYAFQDTTTPVKAGAVAVASNILFSLVLMGPLEAAGLAVATSLASVVNFTLLIVMLRRHVGPLPGRDLARSLAKTGLAGLGMAATCLILEVLWPWGGHGFLPQLGHLVGGLGLGTTVFLGVAVFLGCEEVQVLRRLFQRRST